MSFAGGKVGLVEKNMVKGEQPKINPGDTVKVHVKIKEGDKERIQIYEGTVMGFSNTGSRRSITVRKISHGVGVERVFPIYSPVVAKIECVQEASVRRAKLGYLRKLSGKAAKVKAETEIQ